MDDKDFKIRKLSDRISSLEKRLHSLESIPQVSSASTLSDIILVVNKIVKGIKRKS